MTIWEYCYLFWKAECGPRQGVLRFCSAPDDITFTDLCGKLAEPGYDGWEAVSHTYIDAPAPGYPLHLSATASIAATTSGALSVSP